MVTIKIFNEVRNRLAFAKAEQSTMRGFLMSRFLEALPNEKKWYSGLTDDQAFTVVKESVKQWGEVYSILKCLKGPEN
jgi:hypothetical protein